MTRPFAARLLAATAAALIALLCGPTTAQAGTLQPDDLSEAVRVDLPDAPIPQNTPQTPSSSSSDTTTAPTQPPASGVPSATPSPSQPGSTPDSTQPPTQTKQQRDHDQAERELQIEEKQRLLGVMPQFQVVMNGQAAPLTGKQKWSLALHSARDPFYIGWAFIIGGGWGEIVDSNKGYGWGDKGYFERVGANYADNVDGAIIGNALLPQVLHQDPRYFRMGTGSFGRRFIHAALSTVECHGDNGKNQANVSNVLGNFIAGGISNLYYPSDERGAKLTVENGISVTLFGALGGQILEFGPDLQRLVSKKKQVSSPVGPVSDPTQAKGLDGKTGDKPQGTPETPPSLH